MSTKTTSSKTNEVQETNPTPTEGILTTPFTPYKAAQIANAALETAGIEKVLPPQMFYNYTTGQVRKGKKPLIPTVEVDGKTMIDPEGFAAWLKKYIAKQQG